MLTDDQEPFETVFSCPSWSGTELASSPWGIKAAIFTRSAENNGFCEWPNNLNLSIVTYQFIKPIEKLELTNKLCFTHVPITTVTILYTVVHKTVELIIQIDKQNPLDLPNNC